MTDKRNRVPGQRAGFSLVELVLVLSMVAILAAIAAPRYANAVTRYHAETAAQRIVADLALARNRACTSGARRTVTFRPADDEYRIPGVSDLKNPSADYVVKLSGSPYDCDLVSADFGGDTAVVFDGYGVPDSGGQVVIRAGEYQKIIVLDSGSGKAKVQ